MARTYGHNGGSRHTLWKSRPNHSSNKLNKKDCQHKKRREINDILKDKLHIMDIGACDIPNKFSDWSMHW